MSRISLYSLLVLCTLVLGGVPLAEDKPSDPDSEEFEKYTEEDERDAHIIAHAIKRLIVRPDNDKYPYVIKINETKSDEIDKDRNEMLVQYLTPKIEPKLRDKVDYGVAGPIKEEVLIKTSYIDMSKEITVIPMGERGLGYPTRSVYVVLRADKNKTLHYLNLAYVRRQLKRFSVEWSILDSSLFGRNRLELEFCRGTPCDIYHHLFGVCSIVSHACPGGLMEGDAELITRFTWQTNYENGLQGPPAGGGGGEGQGQGGGGGPPIGRKNGGGGGGGPKPGTSGRRVGMGGGVGGGRPGRPGQGPGQGPPGQGLPGSELEARPARSTKSTDVKDPEKNHIPNSLDLLMLKRDDKESGGNKGSEVEGHFMNNLEHKRSTRAKGSMFEKEALLDCNGCEKLGDYFNDYEEDPEFSKLIGSLAPRFKGDVQIDVEMGSQNEEVLKGHKEVPYIGYGNCNLTDLDDLQANYTHDIEDLSKFFLASMRISCDRESETRVRSLFTSKLKLLEIQEDFSVGISRSSQILKYKILTDDEFRTGMAGTFVAAYIAQYRSDYKKWALFGSPEVSPSDPKLSHNIVFLTKLVLRIMDAFTHNLSGHHVRGFRFILRLLRDKFNVVLITIAGEPPESTLKEMLINDLYRLMALKEYILYGMGPTAKSGTVARVAFESFQAENEKRIKRLVDFYGVI